MAVATTAVSNEGSPRGARRAQKNLLGTHSGEQLRASRIPETILFIVFATYFHFFTNFLTNRTGNNGGKTDILTFGAPYSTKYEQKQSSQLIDTLPIQLRLSEKVKWWKYKQKPLFASKIHLMKMCITKISRKNATEGHRRNWVRRVSYGPDFDRSY